MNEHLKKDLLKYFKDINKDFVYVLLRHHDSVFSNLKDIDILIKKKDKKHFLIRTSSFMISVGYFLVSFRIGNCKSILKFSDLNGTTFSFDIRTVISKRKEFMMDEKILLMSNLKTNELGAYILSDDLESAFLLARNYFDRRPLDKKHKLILDDKFSEKTLLYLKKLGFKKLHHDYCTCLISMRKRFNIVSRLKGLYYGLQLYVDEEIKSKGNLVVLYGPDGTGKSTILKKFLQVSEANNLGFEGHHFYDTQKNFKSRSLVIKTLGKSKINRMKDTFVLSFLKNVYSYTERLLVFYLRIKPNLNNRINVICDRFFLDTFTKSKRYQKYYFKSLEVIFHPFYPKPDLTMLLKGSPRLIRSRKSELSLKEIKDSYDFYDFLFNKYKYTKFDVNINKSVEDIVNDILYLYVTFLEERLKLVCDKKHYYFFQKR